MYVLSFQPFNRASSQSSRTSPAPFAQHQTVLDGFTKTDARFGIFNRKSPLQKITDRQVEILVGFLPRLADTAARMGLILIENARETFLKTGFDGELQAVDNALREAGQEWLRNERDMSPGAFRIGLVCLGNLRKRTFDATQNPSQSVLPPVEKLAPKPFAAETKMAKASQPSLRLLELQAQTARREKLEGLTKTPEFQAIQDKTVRELLENFVGSGYDSEASVQKMLPFSRESLKANIQYYQLSDLQALKRINESLGKALELWQAYEPAMEAFRFEPVEQLLQESYATAGEAVRKIVQLQAARNERPDFSGLKNQKLAAVLTGFTASNLSDMAQVTQFIEQTRSLFMEVEQGGIEALMTYYEDLETALGIVSQLPDSDFILQMRKKTYEGLITKTLKAKFDDLKVGELIKEQQYLM